MVGPLGPTATTVPILLGRIDSYQAQGQAPRLLSTLADRGLLFTSLGHLQSGLRDARWVEALEQTGGLARISETLKQLAPPEREEGDYLRIQRPVEGMTVTHALRLFGTSPNLTTVYGGQAQFTPPPAIPLPTEDDFAILQLLEYAGIYYRSLDSPAAKQGIEIFKAAREFARETDCEAILFDWDHTLDNYKIFESLWRLIVTKLSKEYPFGKREDPMTSLETARPLMHELVMGLMVGFAIRQGLVDFTQWESYRPQVGLATLTWPDRLGVVGRYVPLISLMQGCFPGLPGNYDRTVQSSVFVHLDDFLNYADRLLDKFQSVGFEGLNAREQDEINVYFRRGKAHYSKPLGAIAEKWALGALMLFDDSFEVFADLRARTTMDLVAAVYTQNPYTRPGKDVRERDKISLGLTRRSRMLRTARTLARVESQTAVPSLVKLFQEIRGGLEMEGLREAWAPSDLSPTPEGSILRLYETGTILPEFHRHYVDPTNRLKRRIRDLVRKAGGPENRR